MLAAKKFFKNDCEIYNLSEKTIGDYLIMQNKELLGTLDSKLISVKEFRELNSKLEKIKLLFILNLKIFLKKKNIIQILIFLTP